MGGGGATGGTGNVGDLEKAYQTVGRHYLGYRHRQLYTR